MDYQGETVHYVNFGSSTTQTSLDKNTLQTASITQIYRSINNLCMQKVV
jgi:hypothetical protein